MRTALLAPLALLALLVAACGQASGDSPTLLIGGIPDQDVSLLEERFGGLAEVLSEEVGIPVAYQPAVDYAGVVTAFSQGDVMLGWFGGLTGVQARLETPGASAVVQRPIDTEFRSVFIAHTEAGATSLSDLVGRTFTFGSESSTSGHLMPRFFLQQAGIDPEEDFATVSYSGSHDTTWSLVEAGAFDAGALNAAVWDRAVEQGQVDTTQVDVVERTEPYVDYHWVAHPDLDEVYGPGTTDAIVQALLTLHESEEGRRLLDLFEDDRFITTDDDAYTAIEQVARDLGLIGG